eukprot:scaffold1437_cov353-Prasinococcus_capsulatus_cf.AAC.15
MAFPPLSSVARTSATAGLYVVSRLGACLSSAHHRARLAPRPCLRKEQRQAQQGPGRAEQRLAAAGGARPRKPRLDGAAEDAAAGECCGGLPPPPATRPPLAGASEATWSDESSHAGRRSLGC